MRAEEFRRHGHDVVDWIADYMAEVATLPVCPDIAPGSIRARLPEHPPEQGEAMEAILADFREQILPGVTHWNHPRFFAYFPANNSGPSILGEMISAALGVNAMVWQSCPAATELEELVMDWVRQLLDLPAAFRGSIQDTASTATLCALLCARERCSGQRINQRGMSAWPADRPLRAYASTEAHSSVIKGAKIAGFGVEQVVAVATDACYAMDPEDLARQMEADRAAGRIPCCVIATVGSTSLTAIDPLESICAVARRYEDVWIHVDAALAGSAALLPEKREILRGVEEADSFVFNPHKWLFTNFDCSAFYCRHPEELTRTFAINPEYLKTAVDEQVTNYRDWGIQLGRRFRALKLWFVLRHFGAAGLRERLRAHLALAQEFASWVDESPDFVRLAPVPLNTVCFRYKPAGLFAEEPTEARTGERIDERTEQRLARLNRDLLDRVNRQGDIFCTHTSLGGQYCLRMSIGQTHTSRSDVGRAWQVLQAAAEESSRDEHDPDNHDPDNHDSGNRDPGGHGPASRRGR